MRRQQSCSPRVPRAARARATGHASLLATLCASLVAFPAEARSPETQTPAPVRVAAQKAKGSNKPKPRAKGSAPGKPDASIRRVLTGRHPQHVQGPVQESSELLAMRELDHELFPPRKAPPSSPWATTIEVPDGPRADASGLPPKGSVGEGDNESEAEDSSWLTRLKHPDFPVRLEPSVVRYLRYYKTSKRGRYLVKAWMKKSGRYREAIRRTLNKHGLPQDLVWLAMVESAFDATIHSHAGAAGLWQFMPATGRIYGLTVNRQIDERLDPERSTLAALRHLKDLHDRFGTWELAFGAYNMGYGGMLSAIRRFNTNDYWELRRLEAGLPYETALYVPKIMALAIVANNCDVFGCKDLELDAPLPYGDDHADRVGVAPGVTLEDVAKAAGVDEEKVRGLNPHVVGSRMPPLQLAASTRTSWSIYVPEGTGAKVVGEVPVTGVRRTLATYEVRWGEPLDTVAAAFGTSVGYIQALNDLEPRESPRPGATLFVPAGRTPKPAREIAEKRGIIAVIPDHGFAVPRHRRVFYEPVFGDRLVDVARVVGVSEEALRRWNHLDPRAALQEGMKLQLFVPQGHRPAGVRLYEEADVEPITVESPAFFAHAVGARGRTRVEVTCTEGETWRSLSQRYGVSLGELERINHRSRRSKLHAGDTVVVYAKSDRVEGSPTGQRTLPIPEADPTSGRKHARR